MAPKKAATTTQGKAKETCPAASTPPAPSLAAQKASQQQAGQQPSLGSPNLEPWMRQTVVLKLKEVDGRVPDMSREVFGKKMVLEHGFSKAETLSIHSLIAGMFYVTFASVAICKRYWEMVRTAGPDSPFSRFLGNCPVQREERRVTVSMRNPHIPGKDIATYLKRFCTVVRDPTHILDGNGFWTGKWSVIVRLHKDSAFGGLKHLPQFLSLGNSSGLIYYPDMPQICRKCSGSGHSMKDCTEAACRICRVAGHESKDCPKRTACNLCGEVAHVYKDCPKRSKTYASVAAKGPVTTKSAPTATAAVNRKKEGKRSSAPPPPPIAHAPSPARVPTPPATPTEATSFAFPPSEVLSPAPRPTQPPFSPAAVLTPPPTTAVVLSLEDFPPLAPAGTLQRKRKGRDSSPSADSSKKKVVEVIEDPLPEEEVMEQLVEELVSEPESVELLDCPEPQLLDRLIEEGLLELPEPAVPIDEEPPDRSGN